MILNLTKPYGNDSKHSKGEYHTPAVQRNTLIITTLEAHLFPFIYFFNCIFFLKNNKKKQNK